MEGWVCSLPAFVDLIVTFFLGLEQLSGKRKVFFLPIQDTPPVPVGLKGAKRSTTFFEYPPFFGTPNCCLGGLLWGPNNSLWDDLRGDQRLIV